MNRNSNALGIGARLRNHIVMNMIGIRLKQLQPGAAARTKQHGEREAHLRQGQILTQTIPGTYNRISTARYWRK